MTAMRPEPEPSQLVWWVMLIFLILAIACMLAGCGSEVRPPSQTPEPAPVFGSIGATLAWCGGIGAAAGLALSLVSLFYPPLQPFAAIFRLVGIGGAGVSVTGAAYLWIANHYWWVLAMAAVAGCAVGWYFWPRIHSLLDKRLKAS